jgi:cytidyltransferase-like protein
MWSVPSLFSLVQSIFEAKSALNKVVVIYPGRFQPFHRGHASVFDRLPKQFDGADTYIATSDVVDPIKSPFTFIQKKQMMIAAGVAPKAIRQVKNPYMAIEILADYHLPSTGLVFAISEKDMQDNPRFSFKNKKDGSPSYFQPYKGIDQMDNAGKHGYIATISTLKFKVNGAIVNSASQIREAYRAGSDNDRKHIIFDLYGKFDPVIYQMFNDALVDGQ